MTHDAKTPRLVRADRAGRGMTESTPTASMADLHGVIKTVGLFVIVPLTVYLGGPPVWSQDLAQTECEEVIESRLEEDSSSATTSWVHLPTARWVCESNGRPVADLGWWVTETTSETSELRE